MYIITLHIDIYKIITFSKYLGIYFAIDYF